MGLSITSMLKRFFGSRGIVWTVALLCASLGISVHHLFWRTGPLSTTPTNYLSWYTASAMWASGYGLGNPGISQDPAWGQFFSGAITELDAAAVNGAHSTGQLTPEQLRHRYLLLAVGVTWRLLGISWQTVKYLQVIAFVLTSFLLFRTLCRMAPAYLSLLLCVPFMTTPGVLATLQCMRDYWKAPFFMAAILFLAHLMTGNPLRIRRLLVLAALVGGVLGFGMGFRQDMTICLPPVLVGLALCRLETDWRKLRRLAVRGAATALLMGAFVLAALPIIVAEIQTGAHSADQAVAGLADHWVHPLGVKNGSYTLMYSCRDEAYMVTRTSYGQRVAHIDAPFDFGGPESERMSMQFLWAAVRGFPADFFVRGYATVLWVLRGCPYSTEDPGFCGIVFAPSGLYIASAAIIATSCFGVGPACALLLLLLYFAGYPSLEFAYRHAFHLSVVPIVFTALLLSACRRIWRAIRDWRNARKAGTGPTWRASLGVIIRRMVVFVSLAAFILLGPFSVARAIQHIQVGRFVDKCSRAQLVSEPTESLQLENAVYFRLKMPMFLTTNRWREPGAVATEYYVAKFSGKVKRLGINYDGQPRGEELMSDDVEVNLPGIGEDETVNYFLPAYAICSSPLGWMCFSGISLPPEEASEFRGLFKVSNPDDFGLLPCIAVPQDTSVVQRFLRMPNLTGALHLSPEICRLSSFFTLMDKEAGQFRTNGDRDGEIRLYQKGLKADPQCLRCIAGLAAAYRAKGDTASALQMAEGGLALAPSFRPFEVEKQLSRP